MSRILLAAAIGATLIAGGAAQAQTICCVAPQDRADGLRGYADYRDNGGRSGPSGGLRGYVGVGYGDSRAKTTPPAVRTETWGGEAAIAGQMGGLGLQGDVRLTDDQQRGGGDRWQVSPTVHVFQRNPYGLIGGWAGWSHSGGTDLLGAGAEGQAYFSRATIYGSIGYGHLDQAVNQNLYAGRLEGRYFITDNFSLGVQGGLVRIHAGGTHSTLHTWGLGAEFQPNGAPVSILAGYTHGDVVSSTAESNTVRLGLRWNFDGGSLIDRDRSGAPLNNVVDIFQN